MNNKNYAIEINGLKKIYNFKKANAFEALKGYGVTISTCKKTRQVT